MKRKTLKPVVATAIAILTVSMVTGCTWSIGSGKDAHHFPVVQPTRGQQLIDLKRAMDDGAITEREYEDAKRRIVNQ